MNKVKIMPQRGRKTENKRETDIKAMSNYMKSKKE